MGLKDIYEKKNGITIPWDKIRPKWDWKIILPRITYLSFSLIKSDQNGIERALLVV